MHIKMNTIADNQRRTAPRGSYSNDSHIQIASNNPSAEAAL